MYKKKKILALIPARGGSKRLPRKNVKPLAGKPLIAWTIERARQSRYIDRIIVSTEDRHIAAVSRKFGAEVPFMRPKKLAGDTANGMDVVFHSIAWMETNSDRFDLILLLQPTSPLRTADDIDAAIELLFSKKAKAVVSICESEHHPYWANTIPESGSMKGFIEPEIKNKNRQELPVFYRLNGALYIAYINYLSSNKSFLGDETFAYVMPPERSVDIDTHLDFIIADALLDKPYEEK